jgi:hypothetical protein
MLTAAALCPAPPLLIPELTGAAQVAADLRAACLAAVTELAEGRPDVIVIVGGAEQTRTWPPGSRLNLAAFAPGRAGAGEAAGRRSWEAAEGGSGQAATRGAGEAAEGGAGQAATRGSGEAACGLAGLPATVGVGGWLLDQAGYPGEQVLQSVGYDESAAACARLGADLAGQRERVALLVMADGSARRGLKAPGYLDERSEAFDAGVERAVRDGDLRSLLRIHPELARELMATGRAAWQVLAGAGPGRDRLGRDGLGRDGLGRDGLGRDGLGRDGLGRDGTGAAALTGEAECPQISTEIRYSGDPFGVAYLVASVRVRE